MVITAINPATGDAIQSYPESSVNEVETILEQADRAFAEWRRDDLVNRARMIKKAAELLHTNQEPYARLMAQEMGKPLAQGRSEIEKCAWLCDYFAEQAERFLAPEFVATEASKSFVVFEPLGIILAVMPWNFPFWQRCSVL